MSEIIERQRERCTAAIDVLCSPPSERLCDRREERMLAPLVDSAAAELSGCMPLNANQGCSRRLKTECRRL